MNNKWKILFLILNLFLILSIWIGIYKIEENSAFLMTSQNDNFQNNLNENNLLIQRSGKDHQVENDEEDDVKIEEKINARQDIPESEHSDDISGKYSRIKYTDVLQIPEEDMAQFLLYDYVQYGLQKYCEEKKIDEVFYCNVNEFYRMNFAASYHGIEDYEFSADLAKEIIPPLQNNIYNIFLEGETKNLYMQIDTFRMKIFIYNEECWDNRVDENPLAAWVRDDNGILVDAYAEDLVESDWEDIPEGMQDLSLQYESKRLLLKQEQNDYIIAAIAYGLDRYCDENEIEGTFYFDIEQDVIGCSARYIFTVRLRSDKEILYMDLDYYHGKIHVYPIED